jgi:hypothetical protein
MVHGHLVTFSQALYLADGVQLDSLVTLYLPSYPQSFTAARAAWGFGAIPFAGQAHVTYILLHVCCQPGKLALRPGCRWAQVTVIYHEEVSRSQLFRAAGVRQGKDLVLATVT